MSLSELERLVNEAEADASLRHALRRCGSEQELILTARRLGYRITRLDLQRAWQQEQQEDLQPTEITAAQVPVTGARRR